MAETTSSAANAQAAQPHGGRRYLFGVGGTGSKCLEAFVHLCAMGAVASTDTIEVRVIDLDVGNGNLARLQNVLDAYQDARALVRAGAPAGSYVFGPNFSYKDGARNVLTWTAQDNAAQGDTAHCRTLDALITAMHVHTDDNAVNQQDTLLMRTLYSKDERSMDLAVGVRGRPTIGSLICKQRLNLKGPYWSSLFGTPDATQRTQSLRVMLVGSMFGGTGASFTPTLARAIHQWAHDEETAITDCSIGMTMLLPYFDIEEPTDSKQADEVHAQSGQFILNTMAAMKYYSASDIFSQLSDFYVVGNAQTAECKVPFCLGDVTGIPQRNDAMPPEVVAAGAIQNFLFQDDEKKSLRYVGRTANKPLFAWDQFPGGVGIAVHSAKLARAAMLVNNYLADINSRGLEDVSRFSSLLRFIPKSEFLGDANRRGWDSNTKKLRLYFNRYLAWLMMLKDTGMTGTLDPDNALPQDYMKDNPEIPAPVDLIQMRQKSTDRITDSSVTEGNHGTWSHLLTRVAHMAPAKKQVSGADLANQYGAFFRGLIEQCILSGRD